MFVNQKSELTEVRLSGGCAVGDNGVTFPAVGHAVITEGLNEGVCGAGSATDDDLRGVMLFVERWSSNGTDRTSAM